VATWPVCECLRVVDGVVQPKCENKRGINAVVVKQERFVICRHTILSKTYHQERHAADQPPRVSVRNTLLTIFQPAVVRLSTR
jgi:hypothetical protein